MCSGALETTDCAAAGLILLAVTCATNGSPASALRAFGQQGPASLAVGLAALFLREIMGGSDLAGHSCSHGRPTALEPVLMGVRVLARYREKQTAAF